MDKITFKVAAKEDEKMIFSWLSEPHMIEFWDNSQEHKEDISNFIHGGKQRYLAGTTKYFIGLIDNMPFAFILGDMANDDQNLPAIQKDSMSKFGHTIFVDFGIGNKDYIGKGLASKTLEEFILYYQANIDSKADTFFIDPDENNPRAKHVYEKAGFKHVGEYQPTKGAFVGHTSVFMVKKFSPTVTLEPAMLNEYPMIQNMARFYVYDLSKECGHISDEWRLPANGLFESFDFKNYFEEDSRRAYLIKVYGDIAGFILLNQVTTNNSNDWNIGEFFILGRYQGNGIGKQAAKKIWRLYPGEWEVSVIPENASALAFWENAIRKFTNDRFVKETKLIDFDKDQPKRIIFTFDSGCTLEQKIT